MSWLCYDFKCPCGHVYEDLVQGTEGRPDPCPKCSSTEAVRCLTTPVQLKEYIPMYPGNKRMMAGYGAQERRPAAKQGRQISVPRSKS